jgi:hypothetical protein
MTKYILHAQTRTLSLNKNKVDSIVRIDKSRIVKTLASKSIPVPQSLSREAKRLLIISHAK